MRHLVFVKILLLGVLGGVTPLQAQMSADDLIRLGIQVLGGANGNQQRPVQGETPRMPTGTSGRVQQRSAENPAVIAEIQRRLSEQGYDIGNIDGVAGSRTRQAIVDFQRRYGLAPTGRADEAFLYVLRASPNGAQQAEPRMAAPPGYSPQSPSFDCSAAQSATERVICASPDLAALDQQLGRLYSAASRTGATTVNEQRQWIARRNRCSSDTSCIAAAYYGRMSELQMAGAQNAPPSSVSTDGSAAFSLLQGFDLPNGDYRSGLDDPRLRRIGYQACQQLCAVDGRCRGFTYNLRGEVCILKDRIGGQSRFAGAVSGIKGSGGPGSFPTGEFAGAGAPSAFADFVHMALMSDTEAYFAEAPLMGIAYIQATGSEDQCRQAYQVSSSDEFARRDYLDQAALLARDVLAALPTRPRRVEMPLEATYMLADYDFDRNGFPFASYQNPRVPILAGGKVGLMTMERPVTCRGISLSNFGDTDGRLNFTNLIAEHESVPGIDFLPMPPDQARAFRSSGQGKVLLKATLVVEPRAQGRGPLKGRISALAAYDPGNGRLLQTWQVEGVESAVRPSGDGVPLTSEMLALLLAPAVEPLVDQNELDNAATQYFRYHENGIRDGNPPPQSPLPIEAMRGRKPEVIAALNRDRLRAVLKENQIQLPISVTIEQRIDPQYSEEKGLYFQSMQPDSGSTDGLNLPRNTELSSRDRPLYGQFFTRRNWEDAGKTGFRESVLYSQPLRMGLELDRIVVLEPVPMDIEQAAARGLVGYTGGTQRDHAVLRLSIDINEVRAEKESLVVGAALHGVSVRWASDNTVIADHPASAFRTVEGIRRAAEAALPRLAAADNLLAPSAGTRFNAEMADLLQLRYQPETMEDRVIERMMITRFAYEASVAEGQTPLWGNFFRELTKPLTTEEMAARRGEFRAWSEARAAALPASVTIKLHLADAQNGKVAPFERRGPHPYGNTCRALAAKNDGRKPDEKESAGLKLCAVLDAAWKTPERNLFMNGDSIGYSRELRFNCDDDVYCATLYNASVALKLPFGGGHDIVRIDRLPVLDDAVRHIKDRELALEIAVEPTGMSVQDAFPETLWGSALVKAHDFDRMYGAGIVSRLPDTHPPGRPVMVYQARAVSARIVDVKTGAVVAEPALAEPPPLPFETLGMPETKVGGFDLLGMRLGMPFVEAEKIIRDHMNVGKVLTADRKRQLGAVSGEILPYTSGRIYVSTEGTELIGILDEPPAAAETVVGAWRILRLPKGGADPTSLRATLTERYGEPTEVKEVSLPFMNKGVAFFWLDFRHSRCETIDFSYQDGLWQDENGNASWLPPSMIRAYYPALTSGTLLDVRNEPLPQSALCPHFLGVRYSSNSGRNAGEHPGDEIVTWLSNNRGYAELFHKNRLTPSAVQAPAGEAKSKIKF